MMPDALRILSKKWSVRTQTPKGGKDVGECTFSTATIWVSPNQSIDHQRDTLLHEAMHAIEEELGAGMRERQIKLMATGILDLLRSNPALVAYLIGE